MMIRQCVFWFRKSFGLHFLFILIEGAILFGCLSILSFERLGEGFQKSLDMYYPRSIRFLAKDGTMDVDESLDKFYNFARHSPYVRATRKMRYFPTQVLEAEKSLQAEVFAIKDVTLLPDYLSDKLHVQLLTLEGKDEDLLLVPKFLLESMASDDGREREELAFQLPDGTTKNVRIAGFYEAPNEERSRNDTIRLYWQIGRNETLESEIFVEPTFESILWRYTDTEAFQRSAMRQNINWTDFALTFSNHPSVNSFNDALRIAKSLSFMIARVFFVISLTLFLLMNIMYIWIHRRDFAMLYCLGKSLEDLKKELILRLWMLFLPAVGLASFAFLATNDIRLDFWKSQFVDANNIIGGAVSLDKLISELSQKSLFLTECNRTYAFLLVFVMLLVLISFWCAFRFRPHHNHL